MLRLVLRIAPTSVTPPSTPDPGPSLVSRGRTSHFPGSNRPPVPIKRLVLRQVLIGHLEAEPEAGNQGDPFPILF